MQLDWFLAVCIVEGICDHRGMKSAISPTHFSFPSFTGAGHNCKMNGWYFILVSSCWLHPVEITHQQRSTEQHRMRVRKSESLCDSWNNQMIVTERLTNYKLHIWYGGKDGGFRDTAFIMFNPFKNKNIWGGRVALQCCRRNLTFS